MPRQTKRHLESDCHGKEAVAAGNAPTFNTSEHNTIITPNAPPEFPPVDVSTWGEAATDAYWTDEKSPAFGKFVCAISDRVTSQQSRKDQLANVLSMNRMREMLGEEKRQEWIQGVMRHPKIAEMSQEEKLALFSLLMQDPEHVPKTLGSLIGVPGKSPYQMDSQ
jgi:hypothetical protein